MSRQTGWDYLIVTASNEAQGAAYSAQLARRKNSPVLAQVREVMVIADPEGKRVGSGGSTIYCLMQVVQKELAREQVDSFATVEEILRRLRILIVHAGGDSRRLPAYGPCGKIFIPVPGGNEQREALTLFDRLFPEFIKLPPGCPGKGQVVVGAGDALILFDASDVSLAVTGMTALTCPATPEHASKHGVFCPDASGRVRLYLQKPNVEQQRKTGAVNDKGRTLLDIGVMSFDSGMAMALFKAFGIGVDSEGRLEWAAEMKEAVFKRGVDFYREICCALGTEATAEHCFAQAKGAGSSWSEEDLRKFFEALKGVPFHLQRVPECRFLHFGTTKQLIQSGMELREYDGKDSRGVLAMNNRITGKGTIEGEAAWVEGCWISAPLKLSGQNVVVGLRVSRPLSLPVGACVDVLRGQKRNGGASHGAQRSARPTACVLRGEQRSSGGSHGAQRSARPTGSVPNEEVWFVRCYGIGDSFKESVEKGASFCGRRLMDWLREVGAAAEEVWEAGIGPEERTLWNARVFPEMTENEEYRDWLWMFEPEKATGEQKAAFLKSERYSAAEIAVLADQEKFFEWRGQS